MLIGRKLYVRWSDMVVVGLGSLDFVPESLCNSAPFERAVLSNLVRIHGAIIGGSDEFEVSLSSDLCRLDKIFEDPNSWILEREELLLKPMGFCGRRLLVPVGEGRSVCMDKIVGDPHELFGLSAQPAFSAKLFDVSYFDGTFIESELGRPKVSPQGKRIEQIFEESALFWDPEAAASGPSFT